jgi:hypothetical protein
MVRLTLDATPGLPMGETPWPPACAPAADAAEDTASKAMETSAEDLERMDVENFMFTFLMEGVITRTGLV